MEKTKIVRGLRYGLIAGLISTVVTDLVSLLIFLVMGESFPAFFALLGKSFLTLINVEAAFPLWQGLALHYSIGILTGLTVGVATNLAPALQFGSYRKNILSGIIVTQVEGLTLFFLMSLILSIPQSDMLVMYGLGIFLHTIWGAVLGVIITSGQKSRSATVERELTAEKQLKYEPD
jgi:hypothetical protein